MSTPANLPSRAGARVSLEPRPCVRGGKTASGPSIARAAFGRPKTVVLSRWEDLLRGRQHAAALSGYFAPAPDRPPATPIGDRTGDRWRRIGDGTPCIQPREIRSTNRTRGSGWPGAPVANEHLPSTSPALGPTSRQLRRTEVLSRPYEAPGGAFCPAPAPGDFR